MFDRFFFFRYNARTYLLVKIKTWIYFWRRIIIWKRFIRAAFASQLTRRQGGRRLKIVAWGQCSSPRDGPKWACHRTEHSTGGFALPFDDPVELACWVPFVWLICGFRLLWSFIPVCRAVVPCSAVLFCFILKRGPPIFWIRRPELLLWTTILSVLTLRWC
jgi:hypothetical protein